MNQIPTIIFVCEHGAAKSIIAAAYFNKLAEEANSHVRAIARGTHPDPELSPKAIAGLRNDGLTPSELAPQKLLLTDVESAQRIITFCELPAEYHSKTKIEHWDGVPPVGEDYQKARDAIIENVKQLIVNIA